jgi:hypothetical protein
MVGGSGLLQFDGLEPWVLARRLVEVAVDAKVTLGRSYGGACLTRCWHRLRIASCAGEALGDGFRAEEHWLRKKDTDEEDQERVFA